MVSSADRYRNYRIAKRKVENARFVVVVCCQGMPYDYQCKTLVGALLMYAKQYICKRKYGTMNFTLKQVFLRGTSGEH